MKNVVCSTVALGSLVGIVSAFDYKVSGSAESFTKAGFNNQNITAEQAPTESFTTLFGQLNVNGEIVSGLRFGLGGAIGGLVFDSTNTQTQIQTAAAQSSRGRNRTAVEDSYFGTSFDANRIQNYMIHNAFLEYRYDDYLYLKAGRYESKEVGEYFSGFTQGAEGYVKLNVLKLWAFFSNRRAFAYNQWFNDYFRVNGTHQNSNVTRNTYAIGLDVETSGLKLSAFSYYADSRFVAPGASISFDSNPNFKQNGFRSISRIHAIFPIALSCYVGSYDAHGNGDIGACQYSSGRDWGRVAQNTATLHIEQRFELDKMNFGLGYYQNFGNANALIGTWGSPLQTVDIWTASAFDYGRSLNDVVAANAITGYGFIGIDYNSFSWSILTRATNSPRSAEQSVGLSLSYNITDDMKVSSKIEWFTDTTKAGYSPYIGANTLANKRTDDRSHIFFILQHTF